MSEFLSLPKFLNVAREQGLDVTERTLNYYIARGLLPRPMRKPFVGADGRVGYLPQESLKQLRKILQLKEEGLKLEQIRRTLEGKGVAQQPDLQQKEEWQRELVFRYLRHLPAGHYPPARMQLAQRLAQPEKLSVEELREFQVATLAPLVGEAEAGRWVGQFYLRLPVRELERQLHLVAKEHTGKGEEAGPARIWLAVRQAVGNYLLRRIGQDELGDYLNRLLPAVESARRELGEAGWLGEGFQRVVEALRALRHPDKENARAELDRLRAGLELLELARRRAELEQQSSTWLSG